MKDKVLEALELIGTHKVIDPIEGKGYLKDIIMYEKAYNTIKQALQSNVSEGDINEALQCLVEIQSQKLDIGNVSQRYSVQVTKIAQVLHKCKSSQPQPTLEELKQSIIDRLNEYNCGKKDGDIDFYLWKNKQAIIWEFGFKDKDYIWAKYDKIHNLTWISPDVPLPLDLAHDITKFFMYSDEVKR